MVAVAFVLLLLHLKRKMGRQQLSSFSRRGVRERKREREQERERERAMTFSAAVGVEKREEKTPRVKAGEF